MPSDLWQPMCGTLCTNAQDTLYSLLVGTSQSWGCTTRRRQIARCLDIRTTARRLDTRITSGRWLICRRADRAGSPRVLLSQVCCTISQL